MAITNVPVTGKYITKNGAPAVGTVTFTPSRSFANGATTVSAPTIFTLNATGEIPAGSVVKATNDAQTIPSSGIDYVVTESVHGMVRTYRLSVRVHHKVIDLGVTVLDTSARVEIVTQSEYDDIASADAHTVYVVSA